MVRGVDFCLDLIHTTFVAEGFTPMNYFNTRIIERHDDIMMLNSWMVDTFNVMLSFPWLSEGEQDALEDELASYLCYDV